MLLSTLALVLTAPALYQSEEPRELYNRAVAHVNAGQHVEARAVLAELVRAHPRYFHAYRVWWDTVGKVDDAESESHAATVKRDVEGLAEVG